jgi:tetratricopeptide (TPR) repeat protein
MPDRSLEVLLRAEALDAAVTDYDIELSRRLAHALMQQGQLNRARSVLESGLQAEPTSLELRAGLAVLQLLEGDAAGAEAAARELLEITPHRFFIQMVAYALSEQGKYGEALTWAERAREMSPSRVTTTLVAWILIRGNLDVDRGIDLALAAQQITPGFRDRPDTFTFVPSPEHCLGLAYLKRGDFDRAEQMLTRAAQLRPDRVQIREDLQKAKARERVAGR